MNKKVLTAIGNDEFVEYLRNKGINLLDDISYQEAVIETLKRELVDVLIIYEKLPGEKDKYIFIEKIREIDKQIKIIVILEEEDENYKSFLYSKGIFDIFVDGKNSMEELLNSISKKDQELDIRDSNKISIKEYYQNGKNGFNGKLTIKFQKQQIITFAGVGSYGKTLISTNFSKILASKSNAKVLLIDLDTVNANISGIMGIKSSPDNPEYILPSDKNSSLNYMVEAIDKRVFNTNVFERYVIKSKKYPNLDILTGSHSLYVCKNILSSEYYSRILETAKAMYDYIIIDTSSNIFLDSMQFSLLNSNKIFVISEGNYLALERTCRFLSELLPIWGVEASKVEIIINKYTSKSLSKIEIKEILKNYCVSGYINYSELYEENINNKDFKLNQHLKQQYNFILKSLDLKEFETIKRVGINDNLLKIKNKIGRKFFDGMEEIC